MVNKGDYIKMLPFAKNNVTGVEFSNDFFIKNKY